MAHGLPDDSNIKSPINTFPVFDLGELAVRLGSPANYDRSGRVLSVHDFGNGFSPWYHTGVGALDTVYLTNDRAESAGVSIVCWTSADILASAGVLRRTPYLPDEALAFSVMLALEDLEGGGRVLIRAIQADRYYTFYVTYNVGDDAVEIITAEAGDVKISDLSILSESPRVFNMFKLSVDLQTMHYRSVTINDTIYDVSDYSVNPTVIAGVPHLLFTSSISGTVAGEQTVYMDSLVISRDNAQ